jgi:hypothetical protein
LDILVLIYITGEIQQKVLVTPALIHKQAYTNKLPGTKRIHKQASRDEATTPSIPVVGNTTESTFGRIAQRIGAINGKLTAVDAAEADQAADRVQLATVAVVTPMANQTEQGVGRLTKATFTPMPKVGNERAVIIPLPMVGNKGNTTGARPQLSNITLTLTSQSEIHHRISFLHGTLTLSDGTDMRQRMAFLARC